MAAHNENHVAQQRQQNIHGEHGVLLPLRLRRSERRRDCHFSEKIRQPELSAFLLDLHIHHQLYTAATVNGILPGIQKIALRHEAKQRIRKEDTTNVHADGCGKFHNCRRSDILLPHQPVHKKTEHRASEQDPLHTETHTGHIQEKEVAQRRGKRRP